MKKFRLMTAFVIALCLALSVCCALADQTLEGDANVDQRNYPSTAPFIHPPFYNVRLIIEADNSGVITAVKDNGTGGPGSVQEGNEEFWANKNKPYFDAAVNAGLLDSFVGKSRDEVAAMDMTSGGADAVSGATMVSAAAQEAVLNAFDGKTGKTFLEVEGSALPVESVDGGLVTLANALPEDFDLQVLDIRWGVRNEEVVPTDSYTVEIADGNVTISFQDAASLKPGYYYVNVVDASGKYRSPSFEGGPAAAQAPYFIIDSGLTAEDISFDGRAVVLNGADMADYLANIQHVQILAEGAEKPVEQEIVGHHGTVGNFIALDENGMLNADGVVKARNGSENPLFEAGKQYTVTVAAFGYPELVFPYTKADGTAEAAAFGGVISWVKQDEAAAVIEIATAEELAAVNQNLSGNYVLTADIDLNGCEWAPLGVFMPGSDENGQPTEFPDLNCAFTGTFDGNGHTISNFTISQGESYTAGLFGCLANASVSNLTVKDVSAEGFLMVSDVVGYAFMSSVSGVKLENGVVHVVPNEMSEEGMFGGIVGASMGSVITDCEAQVNITIEEGKTANVGIVGGGWQNTSAANCIGHGSIQVGSNCYGIGGVSGCGFGSEFFKDCTAEDVKITVGDNCSYIGGITGYCGGYEPAELGVPVTKVTGCRTKNVTITTGEGAEYVGDFVGGGFLSDEMIVYGPPFDQPTNYELVDCAAE